MRLSAFPVLELDQSLRVTYCNPAAARLLEQLGGSSASRDLFIPEGMEEILDALKSGKKTFFDREVRLNHLVLVERIFTVPESGSVDVFAFEMTKRARAEKEARTAHRHSEERIRRQTEELRVANAALESERLRLYALLDQLPAFVCLLGHDRTLVFVNRRFRELFGDAQGHRCFESMAGRDEPCETCHVLRVLEEDRSVEWQWTSPAGRVYQIYDYPFSGPAEPRQVLKLGIDITERTRIEEELQQNEAKYRLLVEGMNEGLGVTDDRQVLTYVNRRLCEMLGYSPDEMIGRPASDFVDETYRDLLVRQKQLRSSGKHQAYEIAWTAKDRRKVATIVSPKPIYGLDGLFQGSFGIVTDITERRRAEEALRDSERQLRSLSAQLLQAQETERARISRELHDELGQALTMIKLRLDLIRKNLYRNQTALRKDCDETIAYVEQVIANMRRLSRDLSPGILVDLGLVAALRRLLNEFARHSKTKITFKIGRIDGLLSRDAQISLYRILQEALTNIGKHSAAANASVNIDSEGKGVRCTIEDDGTGFRASEASPAGHSLKGMGITILKERVRMLGGSLNLWSEPGKGTRIAVFIPAGGSGA